MTTQTKYDEELKMALEALDQLTNAADTFSVSGVYFNEEVWAKKCLSDAYFAINAIEQTLAQQSNEQVESAEVRLWDSQWINVVNHDNCYQGWNKEDAINHAVKMTEKYIASNFAKNTHPPVPYVTPSRTAQPKEPEQRSVSEHLKERSSDEPVAFETWYEKFHSFAGKSPLLYSDLHCAWQAAKLYTTPPQRPSQSDIKPLTHEQRFDLLTKFEPHKNKWEAPAILIDMVEAAHGIYAPSERRPTDFKE